MLERALLVALAALVAVPYPVAASPAPPRSEALRPAARRLVDDAMTALGGEARLRAISVVRLKAMRTRNALEQSIRPDGPYIDTVDDLVETRRFDRPALRDDLRARGFAAAWADGAKWVTTVTLVSGGEAFAMRDGPMAPANHAGVQAAEESLALGPERVLLTAADAADLHREAPAMLHGFRHDVLAFTWRGAPVRVFVEPVSHMLAAVEITRPRPEHIFWAPWGDVTTRLSFDVWMIEANGIHYPRRWTIESNGRVAESWFIDEVAFNPPDTPPLDVGADLAAKARTTHRTIEDIKLPDAATAVTLVPGITLRPGSWNVTEVETPAGIWVIEGPIGNSYSAQVMREVAAKGQKLIGVITTSDSWPHIGGLREYVARHVPIVALDLNLPQLTRLFGAPHAQAPDRLALHPAAPILRPVTGDQWLGAGQNRMRLMPFRTVTGERQFAIWWPAHRLLYTSDLFTVSADGSIFLPQYLDETRDLVKREQLDVKTIFGMHYGPTDWKALLARVDAKGGERPAG
jgi:hypothetical protein